MWRLEVISHFPEAQTHQTPILFLHGAWHGAWVWEDYFLPYFAKQGFSVHAFSLRAHGFSEGKDFLRWASIGDYVTDLVQVARSLPTPPVIVGHSLGGFVVQKYLEDYDAPAAVLLAPAPAFGGWKYTMRTLRSDPRGYLRAGVTLSPYALINTVERAHATFFSPQMPREEVAKHFARMQDDSFRAYLDFVAFAHPDIERVRERNRPMLIIGGAQDRVFPAAEIEDLGKLYGADVTMLPDTAHDIMLEASWQAAADRMIAWLKEKNID